MSDEVPKPPRRSALTPAKGIAIAFTVLMLVLAVSGIVILWLALPLGVAVAVAGGVVAFAVIATVPAVGRHLLALACAALLALLALLPLAVVVRFVLEAFEIEGRLPIPAGLLIAFVLFVGVAFWYLQGNWLGTDKRRSGGLPWKAAIGAAVLLAVAVLLVLPLILGRGNERPVPRSEQVVSTIDVLLVSERPRPHEFNGVPNNLVRSGQVAPYAHAAGFDIRYSVGFKDGDLVRWTLAGTDDEAQAAAALQAPDAPAVTAPALLNDADRVLVLIVDGTPSLLSDPAALPNQRARAGEITRWRRVARAAAPSGTTSYALLETTSPRRLRNWKASFIRRGTAVRRGGAVSVQGLASQSVTDAAVRLAVAAPTAQEDYSLALKHRPIIRFDTDEAAPRPLDVEALFATGRVRLCFDQRPGKTACEAVPNARALKNEGTHLELPLPRLSALQDDAELERLLLRRELVLEDARLEGPAAPPPQTPPAGTGAREIGKDSAIYVHTVPVDNEDASLLYLDYWWYLPYNPAGSGGGAFCGPGLLIPGINCFDHVSDWEGVTVVLDRTTPGAVPKPIAVHYAQHDVVVSHKWDDLQAVWGKHPDAERILSQTSGGDVRPLVFVASGTHASYPEPCTRKPRCRQYNGAEENEHDGELPWAPNDLVLCGTASCLKMLPTARGGRDPALWNGFEGPWGTRNCFLTYYCDSSSPPAAPGQQDRYNRPWEYDLERKP